jgi:hypothetical protein
MTSKLYNLFQGELQNCSPLCEVKQTQRQTGKISVRRAYVNDVAVVALVFV